MEDPDELLRVFHVSCMALAEHNEYLLVPYLELALSTNVIQHSELKEYIKYLQNELYDLKQELPYLEESNQLKHMEAFMSFHGIILTVVQTFMAR
jgi:ribonucleotide reductase beta subunit family protein with ferritin-like domain